MENNNRDRDRASKQTEPTSAGQNNRKASEETGSKHNSGTTAEFGQSIGRSETLEGGAMGNRNEENVSGNSRSNTSRTEHNMEQESTRRPSGSGFDSSTGRTGSSEISKDDLDSSTGRRGSSEPMENDKSSSRSGSGESRH
jgi:hypothetical protein